jgi:hypothetical protein
LQEGQDYFFQSILFKVPIIATADREFWHMERRDRRFTLEWEKDRGLEKHRAFKIDQREAKAL